jgi:hypothetical protein
MSSFVIAWPGLQQLIAARFVQKNMLTKKTLQVHVRFFQQALEQFWLLLASTLLKKRCTA